MSDSLDYQYFYNYFKSFSRFDGKDFDLALEHVIKYANDNGLSEQDLILIAKIAFNQELGVIRMRKVIKCLIPSRSMPDEVVEFVLDYFIRHYDKNISVFVKKSILQWLVGLIHYHLINPAKTVYLYYDLFWFFLSYEGINVTACNLIYLLAKPVDVSRWYVKQILKAHERFEKPRYTGALLLLFKSYKPECVPEHIPAYAIHNAFGKLPEFITKNFSRAQEKLDSSNIFLHDADSICWQKPTTKNLKRNAIQLIPSIVENEAYKFGNGKPLTAITSQKDLCRYLIEEQQPVKIKSLLSTQEGRFILIFGGKIMHERFSFQVYYDLYDVFFERNPYVSYEEKDNLLKQLSLLQHLMQQCIPVVSKFLAQFIITWDGLEHEQNIYSLLEWLNIESYVMFYECILKYLYSLFVSGTVEAKCKILTCLANFAVNIITTYFHRVLNKIPFLFLNLEIKWDFNELISDLYGYIIKLCKLGWILVESHSLFMITMLDINSKILEAEKKCNLQIWSVPEFITRAGLFTGNPVVFSRIFKFFNSFPSHVDKSIKKDYTDSLIAKNAFIPKDHSIFNCFSSKQIEQLQELVANVNKCLFYNGHLALSCYNYTTGKRNNVTEFIQICDKYCPEFVEFLKHNMLE